MTTITQAPEAFASLTPFAPPTIAKAVVGFLKTAPTSDPVNLTRQIAMAISKGRTSNLSIDDRGIVSFLNWDSDGNTDPIRLGYVGAHDDEWGPFEGTEPTLTDPIRDECRAIAYAYWSSRDFDMNGGGR